MNSIDIPTAIRDYVEAEQHGAGVIALNVAQAGIVTALMAADPSLSDTAAAFRFHKLVDEMRSNDELSPETLARIVAAKVEANGGLPLNVITKSTAETLAVLNAVSGGVHDFNPATGGEYCVTPMLRPDGTVQPCGDPVKGAIHDPQAYATYATELTEALKSWANEPAAVALANVDAATEKSTAYASGPVVSEGTRIKVTRGRYVGEFFTVVAVREDGAVAVYSSGRRRHWLKPGAFRIA